MANHFVITLGRQLGGGGFKVGKELSRQMGIPFYDRELIALCAERTGIPREVIESYDEKTARNLFLSAWAAPAHAQQRPLGQQLFEAQLGTIRELADKEPCIILGRCADFALSGRPNVFRIFLYAPLQTRIERIMQRKNLSAKDARREIERIEKNRKSNYRFFTNCNWGETETYDLCINTATASLEAICSLIQAYVKERLEHLSTAEHVPETLPSTAQHDNVI
ncbi:MAG: AAA family ATPase [Kiritimatiellia bacterium]